MNDQETFWGELDERGVDAVRQEVAKGAWLPPFDTWAANWLALRDTQAAEALAARAEERAEMALALASKANALASEANAVALKARSDARNAWIIALIAITWTVIDKIWPLIGMPKI